MKEYYGLLKKSKLFHGITEEEMDHMMGCLMAVEKKYKKNEFIYRVGDKITSVAFVIEGSVHVIKEDYWGNQYIITEIPKGQIFGETYACLENSNIEVNAVAAKDCEILMLELNRILNTCPKACNYHTKLISNLVNVIALKNKVLTGKMEHISQRNTKDKILSYLSEISLREGSSSFEIPFNRQQLADYLAVDRSALSKELCKLRDEEVLSFNKNYFELK